MKKIGLIGAAFVMASTGAMALPVGSFSVSAAFSPNSVNAGQSTTFTWNSPTGSFCEVEGLPGGNRVGRSGSYTFAATASLTAYVSCERMDVFAGKSASLNVIPNVNVTPTVSSGFNPSTVYINSGGSTNGSTYTWSSSNASSCTSSTFGSMPTSGSLWVGASSQVSQLADTITCTGQGGSAAHTATLDTLPIPTTPAPTVIVYASPSYLSRAGYTSITYNATNYSNCTGQGRYYIYESTGFDVTCTGPGGSGTGFAWVEVASTGIPNFAPMSSASVDGKPAAAQRAALPDLKPLGFDLSKKRYAWVAGDFNKDGSQDVLVHDKLKSQLHVVVGKDGRFPAIGRSIDNVRALNQVKALSLPAPNVRGEIRVTLESQQ